MNIEMSDRPLSWGALDLSLFGVAKDWHGEKIDPPMAFGFVMDQKNLWFCASQQKAPKIHPDARPGEFQAELWKYDVAEFFLQDPSTGRYLEFNLSPNGAWWSAEFTAPRIRATGEDVQFPGVATFADMAADGSWMAAAALPLDKLREHLNFGKDTKLNATFIVNSPDQKFLTATKLSDGEPDFHLPDSFPTVNFFNNPTEGRSEE